MNNFYFECHAAMTTVAVCKLIVIRGSLFCSKLSVCLPLSLPLIITSSKLCFVRLLMTLSNVMPVRFLCVQHVHMMNIYSFARVHSYMALWLSRCLLILSVPTCRLPLTRYQRVSCKWTNVFNFREMFFRNSLEKRVNGRSFAYFLRNIA